MLSLQSSLNDITHHIEINLSRFHIFHKALKINGCLDISASQIEQIPHKFIAAYFCNILVDFIYKIYFKGKHQFYLSSSRIDPEFYEKIDACNNSKRWLHPSFHVTQEKGQDILIAEFDNGILEVKKSIHLPPEYQMATVGDPVAIYLPNSYIEKDRYVAHGDYFGGHPPSKKFKYVLIITFNFSSATALAAMELISQKFNEFKLGFRFSVLLNPSSYTCFDSGVLKIFCEQYEPDLYDKYIFPTIKELYYSCESSFCEDIPIFSKKIAPGIGLFERHVSGIGLKQSLDSEVSYCEYVANGLIDSYMNGNDSLSTKIDSIKSYFKKYEVDINQPYINPGCQDIYTPIV